MSPRHFRKLFYPGLKRVMQGYKELGLYVIKHTDGNLWPILDMIVDSGIDCLDPIDPQAGMDIADVRAKYPALGIKGNVDCAQLMTFGTPGETVAATREALPRGWRAVGAGRRRLHLFVEQQHSFRRQAGELPRTHPNGARVRVLLRTNSPRIDRITPNLANSPNSQRPRRSGRRRAWIIWRAST